MHGGWKRYDAELKAEGTDFSGSLALLLPQGGQIDLDFVSLFPKSTFHGRENGLWADIAHLHFYEKAFVNHIRASQDPQTGMTTYFQPMQTGGFRVFSTPFDDFWCCTGTGVETFSKLGECFAYHDEDTLYIALYHSMALKWPAMGVSME